MKRVSDMSREELAAYVCSHLARSGIEVTLSGGSCVSIYSCNQYVSEDLDFIESRYIPRSKLTACLKEIGFMETNRYFTHPDTDWFLEFPKGPLAAGSEPMTDIITLNFETGYLKIISPTECVKDRLASYFYWNDMQCLNQALMIAQQNDIDLKEVERWSKAEGMNDKYNTFFAMFASKNGELSQ